MNSFQNHIASSTETPPHASAKWYVLNYVPMSSARHLQAENVVTNFGTTAGYELEVFAPTIVKIVHGGGKLHRVASPLLFHYVFVRGSLAQVKKLCASVTGFSFLLSHAEVERYVTITDPEMKAFRMIARFHGNQLPCFASDEVDLEEGDIVEVVRGDFPGLVGTYIPKQRGRTGNLYIQVTNSLSAVVYDIKVEYLRVLEFSKGGKRAYQQIDAFVPRLFAALRVFYSGQDPDSTLIAPLLIFTRRFGEVKIDDTKLEAKLRALLMCACQVLGDTEGYNRAAERYHKISQAITNPWSRALVGLIEAVAERNAEGIKAACNLLPEASPRESATQKRLRDEFEFYLENE